MFIVYAQRTSTRLLGLEPCRIRFEPPTCDQLDFSGTD